MDTLQTHIDNILAHIPTAPGIYSITNTITGQIYIGSSKNMHARLTTHIRALSASKHHSYKLQRGYKEYGLGVFRADVVEECPLDQLLIREQYFMDSVHPKKLLYNVSKTADNTWYTTRRRRTKKKSIETKPKSKTRVVKKKVVKKSA